MQFNTPHPGDVFHAAGLPTFQVSLNERGKKVPAIVKSFTALETAFDPPTRAVNYGIVIQDPFFVVDIDQKKNSKQEKHGYEQWEAIKNHYGIVLPKDQFIVQTQTGGRHLWFRVPGGLSFRHNLDGFDAVDFLGRGKFVVGPGTNFGPSHPILGDICAYRVANGEFKPESLESVPMLHEGLLEDLSYAKSYYTGDTVYKDTENSMYAYKRDLLNAPECIKGTGSSASLYKIACKGRDYGLTLDTTVKHINKYYNTEKKCIPLFDIAEIVETVENAYNYARGEAGVLDMSRHMIDESEVGIAVTSGVEETGLTWETVPKGGLKQNSFHNAVAYLTLPYIGNSSGPPNPLYNLHWLNTFTQKIEYNFIPPWHVNTNCDSDPKSLRFHNDGEILNLQQYLFKYLGYTVEPNRLDKAVEYVAQLNAVHPPRTWLKSLEWDGKPRLETWLTQYLDVKDEAYVRRVARTVIMGLVSRIMQPGCEWHYVLILEGPEGTGKSKAIRALMHNWEEWGGVFDLDNTDKDGRMAMSCKWLFEIAELKELTPRNLDRIKAFVTTEKDTLRAPFKKYIEDFKRQSVCIATINPGLDCRYLGEGVNRRFWPVSTGIIDDVGLGKARDQIFAEAMALYRKGGGELLYLSDPALEAAARGAAKERQVVDPFVQLTLDWFEANPAKDRVELMDLYVQALHGKAENFDGKMRKRLLRALSYIDVELCGNNGTAMRRPGIKKQPLQERLGADIEATLKAIRLRIKAPLNMSHETFYTHLTGEVDPDFDKEMKQYVGQKLMKCEGVTSGMKYNPHTQNSTRCYVIAPIYSEIDL